MRLLLKPILNEGVVLTDENVNKLVSAIDLALINQEDGTNFLDAIKTKIEDINWGDTTIKTVLNNVIDESDTIGKITTKQSLMDTMVQSIKTVCDKFIFNSNNDVSAETKNQVDIGYVKGTEIISIEDFKSTTDIASIIEDIKTTENKIDTVIEKITGNKTVIDLNKEDLVTLKNKLDEIKIAVENIQSTQGGNDFSEIIQKLDELIAHGNNVNTSLIEIDADIETARADVVTSMNTIINSKLSDDRLAIIDSIENGVNLTDDEKVRLTSNINTNTNTRTSEIIDELIKNKVDIDYNKIKTDIESSTVLAKQDMSESINTILNSISLKITDARMELIDKIPELVTKSYLDAGVVITDIDKKSLAKIVEETLVDPTDGIAFRELLKEKIESIDWSEESMEVILTKITEEVVSNINNVTALVNEIKKVSDQFVFEDGKTLSMVGGYNEIGKKEFEDNVNTSLINLSDEEKEKYQRDIEELEITSKRMLGVLESISTRSQL